MKKPDIKPKHFMGLPEIVMDYIRYLEEQKVVDKTVENMLMEFVVDLSNASRHKSHDLGRPDSISDDWADEANDLLTKIEEYERL